MNKDIVLLLTATVQPQVDFMTISNGQERKRKRQRIPDYIKQKYHK